MVGHPKAEKQKLKKGFQDDDWLKHEFQKQETVYAVQITHMYNEFTSPFFTNHI